MKYRFDPSTIASSALCAALWACDPEATAHDAAMSDASDVSAADVTAVDTNVDVATDLPPPMCPTGVDAATGEACVLNVSGRVLDIDDTVVGNQLVTVCGLECFFGRSDTNGSFLISPTSYLPWGRYVVAIHGRPDHASSYVPLTMPIAGDVAYDVPLRVPHYTDTGGLIPDPAIGGTVTAGDVTLTVDPGTRLQFDVEDAELGALGHSLRSAFVPLASAPPFASEGRVVQVHALAPFDLVADRPMALRVANRASLAPGAAVEFVAMGIELFMDPVNAGHAVMAATGHVSADGTMVSTDPGQGIRTVTWIGLRLAGR